MLGSFFSYAPPYKTENSHPTPNPKLTKSVRFRQISFIYTSSNSFYTYTYCILMT